MQLPRMTTRRWMIVVGVVALLLAAELLRERRTFYLGKAARYARGEQITSALRQDYRTRSSTFKIDPNFDQDLLAEKYSPLVDYYSAMGKKYENAASHPWVLVSPDPPEPESPPPPPPGGIPMPSRPAGKPTK